MTDIPSPCHLRAAPRRVVLRGRRLRQRGISLVETMIAMLIGMVILGSITMLAVGELHSTNDSLLVARMNQELRAVMSMMADDLRRADSGRSPDAATNTDPLVISGNGTQVRFSYDCCSLVGAPAAVVWVPDHQITLALPQPDERFGFRLNTTSGVGVIESLRHGQWHPLTQPTLTDVKQLQLCFWAPGTPANACPQVPPDAAKTNGGTPPYMTVRNIRIRLRAELRGHPDVSRSLTETVKVRTNALTKAP